MSRFTLHEAGFFLITSKDVSVREVYRSVVVPKISPKAPLDTELPLKSGLYPLVMTAT